jgi:hypothetical protein
MRWLRGIVCAAGLMGIINSPLRASITFGLQVIEASSGIFTPNSAQVNNLGDTVTMQIYTAIANNDNNQYDDAIAIAKYGFQSTTNTLGGVQGTFGNMTFNTPLVSPTVSSIGVETDGQDVGNTSPGSDPLSNSFWSNSNSATSLAQIAFGPTEVWGDGSHATSNGIGAPTTFIFGTITWTASSIAPGFATVTYQMPRPIGGIVNRTDDSYYQDVGVNNTNPNPDVVSDTVAAGQLPGSDVIFVPGVIISVPEPVDIGLLSFGICCLAIRARKTASPAI